MAEHFSIAMKQFEARFSRLLRHATGDDYDLGSGQIGIIPSRYDEGMRKGNRMINIVGFGPGAGTVQVHENDFAADATHDERVGASRTDHSAAYNANFHTEFRGFLENFRWWVGWDLNPGPTA